MTTRIYLTDVAPRDGLQNQPIRLSSPDKIALVRRLVEAGVASVEATAFVSKRVVPQMADADELLPALAHEFPQLRLSALVPNLKGLERAMEAGAIEVATVLAATETMNLKNIGMDLAEATRVSRQTLTAAREAGLRTRAYIAVAFECPFEGLVPTDRVLRLAEEMQAARPEEIVIADTIGAASPAQVRLLFSELSAILPIGKMGVHLHDTRGMGVANAWAAMEEGVRRFDSSVGGIGGCPFAPGAAGNLATEDLVLMARQCGMDTGIDLDALRSAVEFAEEKLGRPLGGRSMQWIRRKRIAMN